MRCLKIVVNIPSESLGRSSELCFWERCPLSPHEVLASVCSAIYHKSLRTKFVSQKRNITAGEDDAWKETSSSEIASQAASFTSMLSTFGAFFGPNQTRSSATSDKKLSRRNPASMTKRTLPNNRRRMSHLCLQGRQTSSGRTNGCPADFSKRGRSQGRQTTSQKTNHIICQSAIHSDIRSRRGLYTFCSTSGKAGKTRLLTPPLHIGQRLLSTLI